MRLKISISSVALSGSSTVADLQISQTTVWKKKKLVRIGDDLQRMNSFGANLARVSS